MSFLHDAAYYLTIKPRLYYLKKLLPEAKIHPAGSRYVLDPPILSTDVDFLVYGDVDPVILLTAGFIVTEMKDYFKLLKPNAGTDFSAWRRGAINLIVTNDLFYAETYQTATHICKTLNVKVKVDRVVIHECVRKTWGQDLLTSIEIKEYGELKQLLLALNGPHSHAIHQAYRPKHGLVL